MSKVKNLQTFSWSLEQSCHILHQNNFRKKIENTYYQGLDKSNMWWLIYVGDFSGDYLPKRTFDLFFNHNLRVSKSSKCWKTLETILILSLILVSFFFHYIFLCSQITHTLVHITLLLKRFYSNCRSLIRLSLISEVWTAEWLVSWLWLDLKVESWNQNKSLTEQFQSIRATFLLKAQINLFLDSQIWW